MSVTGPDAGLERLRLNGELWTANLLNAVTGNPTIRRTIEGASEVSVTVSDPEGVFRRRAFLDEAARLVVDDLRFTLVKVAKSGDDITLTAEDEIIYLLRQKKGPKKAYRDKITRAQFVKRLVKEAGGKRVRFVSPELTIEQPIGRSGKQKPNASDPAPGIDPKAKGLTVKGAAATLTQKKNADRVIRLALKYNPPRRALVALLTACIVESVMGTRGMTSSVDLDSLGLLQGRQIYNRREDLLDYDYNIRRFFFRPWTGISEGAIKQAKRGVPTGQIAWTIQGPREDLRGRYAEYIPEANNWIRAYFGGEAGQFGSGSRTVEERYAFEVKKDEDYWTAIKRLADEVNWRAFVVGQTFYFAAEPTLIQGRSRMFVREETRGIDQVDWEIDAGKKANTATIAGRIGDWDAPPGTVAVLDESHGPARGRWLVSEIDGSLTQPEVTITLKRPSKPKPEPAPQTRTVSRPGSSGSPTSGGVGALSQIKFVSFASGSPYWGGSRAFFNQLLKPWVEKNYGYRITSEKRSPSHPLSISNPSSDHNEANALSYAVDWGTYSGEAAARGIAKLLGASYTPGSWNVSTISAGGRRWSVQILWIDPRGSHRDHIHVGIKRL